MRVEFRFLDRGQILILEQRPLHMSLPDVVDETTVKTEDELEDDYQNLDPGEADERDEIVASGSSYPSDSWDSLSSSIFTFRWFLPIYRRSNPFA